MGAQVGEEGQHLVEQVLEGGLQTGQVQGVQLEVGQKLVGPGLQIVEVPAQAAHEDLDALCQLGHHEREDGADDDHQHQIGGDHRQGARPSGRPGPAEAAAIQAAEKVTGPVEHKSNAKADEKRLEQSQQAPEAAAHHVQTGQRHDQHHRIGDDQQNAFEELSIHGSSLI